MFSRTVSSFLCATLLIFCLACGDTYDLQSIEISPATPAITGIGLSQQFKVVAKYSNGKSQDVTARATYAIQAPAGPVLAPLTAVTLSASGRLQVIDTACTWNTGVSYPYVVTATFDTFTSKSFVAVTSATGCNAT